ncbi:MAG: outer membrane beta-barrel protein [Longimicrobiales bacterium]|nr:outer membrane beta-barrel protein [Longimicrobiales bacterium]
MDVINRRILAATVLLVGATAAPTAAQSITSPYDFVDSRHGVYVFGASVFTDRGTLGTGPEGGYAAGIEYTYRVGGPFSLAGRIAYLPTQRRVYDDTSTLADSLAVRSDPTFGLEQIATADLSLVMLDASLRFDFTGPRTWYKLQPYALIGVGGVRSISQARTGDAQLPPDENIRVQFQDGFTGHVGAGVEWYVSERITVRADARDLLWKVHIPPGFRSTGRIIDLEQWVQTAHLSLGLSLRF